MHPEKDFGNLLEFAKRDVELYRSSNQNETAIYFTNVGHEQRKTAKAFFEILRFGVDGGDHQIYVRFPDADHFIEMVGGGVGSGRGKMITSNGKNVWEDKQKAQFTIHSLENNLIFIIGSGNCAPEFNFMQKAASYNKGNPFNHPYPNETFVNFDEIEKALLFKYLKIPENIRKIEYCYKTKNEIPKYFVVDYPAYNFNYDNHRFFVIEKNILKEFLITKFVRLRDGGTTIITVLDEKGVKHEFFSPTAFPEKTLCEKWDETELIATSETEKLKLFQLLELELESYFVDKD